MGAGVTVPSKRTNVRTGDIRRRRQSDVRRTIRIVGNFRMSEKVSKSLVYNACQKCCRNIKIENHSSEKEIVFTAEKSHAAQYRSKSTRFLLVSAERPEYDEFHFILVWTKHTLDQTSANPVRKWIRCDHCTGNFSIRNLTPNQTHFQIENSNEIYAAIAANSHESSSGLKNFKNFRIKLKVIEAQSTAIHLEWSISLANIYFDFSTKFRIEYCSFHKNKCANRIAREVMANQTHLKLNDLMPFTIYEIIVRIVSSNAKINNIMSDPLQQRTMAGTMPSPQHLRVLNVTNSSSSLSWNAPAINDFHGLYYIVRFNGTQKIVRSTCNEFVTMYTLDKLKSFTEYEVTVAACSYACSNESNKVQFKTFVAMPSTPQHIRIDFNEGTIKWLPPIIPAGLINFYEMRLNFQEDDGSINEQIAHWLIRKHFVDSKMHLFLFERQIYSKLMINSIKIVISSKRRPIFAKNNLPVRISKEFQLRIFFTVHGRNRHRLSVTSQKFHISQLFL